MKIKASAAAAEQALLNIESKLDKLVAATNQGGEEVYARLFEELRGNQSQQTKLLTMRPVGMEIVAATPEFKEIEAAEGGEKLPSFTMVAYTGSAMRLEGFFHPVVVDLSGVKVQGKQLPMYRQHNPLMIVGHGSAEISADGITASGIVSADNEHSREVVTSAKRGFPWQASIGASVDRMEFVKPGEKGTVNGKVVTGPILIARQTSLSEISFVPRGADRRTSVKVAAQSLTLAQLHSSRRAVVPATLAALHSRRNA